LPDTEFPVICATSVFVPPSAPVLLPGVVKVVVYVDGTVAIDGCELTMSELGSVPEAVAVFVTDPLSTSASLTW
jgi:hypothetical protein